MGPKRSCQSFCISYFTHIHFNHFLFLVNSGTLVLILVLPVISSKLLPTYMWIFHLLFLIFLIMYFCKKYRFSKIIICIDILAFWKMKTWWKCFVMSNEQVIVRIKVSFNHNRWPENTVFDQSQVENAALPTFLSSSNSQTYVCDLWFLPNTKRKSPPLTL